MIWDNLPRGAVDTSSTHSDWQTVDYVVRMTVFLCNANIVRLSFCTHLLHENARNEDVVCYRRNSITLSRSEIIKCPLAVA